MSNGRRGGGRGTRKRGNRKAADARRRAGLPPLGCPACTHPLHVGGTCGVKVKTFNVASPSMYHPPRRCGCPPEKCPAPVQTPAQPEPPPESVFFGFLPLWKVSYDVRQQLAELWGLEIPANLEMTVNEWQRTGKKS